MPALGWQADINSTQKKGRRSTDQRPFTFFSEKSGGETNSCLALATAAAHREADGTKAE
jgi:hypothetical protein